MFTLNCIYNHSKVDESTEQHVKLIVTGKYFPKSLKTQEISLYLIALLISLLIILSWICAVRFWRNNRRIPLLHRFSPYILSLVSFVYQDVFLLWDSYDLVKQSEPFQRVMGFSLGEREADSRSVSCGDHMNLRCEPAS